MVAPDSSWRFSTKPAFACDEVHLYDECVLGILGGRGRDGDWFCADRNSGRVIWRQRIAGRPSAIIGLRDDVIVATERGRAGVYGLSFTTRELHWTSHGPWPWNLVLRLLDFVPNYTNEFRDSPLFIRDGVIVTYAGRMLDPKTGRETGRQKMTEQLRNSVWSGGDLFRIEKRLDCAEFGVLCVGTPEPVLKPSKRDDTDPASFLYIPGFHLKDRAGEPVWVFNASDIGFIGNPNYHGHGWAYVHPYLYFVGSEEPMYTTTDGWNFEPVETLFFLCVLDIPSGEIVQKLPLPRALECGVADADENGVIVEYVDREHGTLEYYDRIK